jgi:hypothetical protein
MKTLPELQKDLKDILLIHGENSEATVRAKCFIGLAFIEQEDYDHAILYLDDASMLCKTLGINRKEIGLDVDYRRGKVMEMRATDPEAQEIAFNLLSKVFNLRQQFDDSPIENENQLIATVDEQLDSTLIYYDRALFIGAPNGDASEALTLQTHLH